MSRKIIICHVNSPLDFYIQKVVEREEYRKIEDKFISYVEQLPPDQGLVDTVQTGKEDTSKKLDCIVCILIAIGVR